MKLKIRKIVTAALFTALICVATMFIKIPSAFKGYLNLGDGVILVAGWILSPTYAVAASALGSALADIFSGYVIYAPATFIIKGLMALVAFYGFKLFSEKLHTFTLRIISGVIAEIIMVLGYFVFEGFLYGFVPSALNIAGNCLQGVAGIIVSTLLIKVFEKIRR